MNKTRHIKSKNFELFFSRDEGEWVGKVNNFGEFSNIEFSIDLDKQNFNEKNWKHVPHFIDFLEINLNDFIQKSFIPLTSFALKSGYFNANENQLHFDFLNTVQILDNSFSANDSNWTFELLFNTKNANNSNTNIDAYGLWIITFSGKCISGIRRINW